MKEDEEELHSRRHEMRDIRCLGQEHLYELN